MSSARQKVRVLLWLFLTSLIIDIFSPSYRTYLGDMFSYGFIFGEHHAAPWGMTLLCVLFLYSRRKDLKKEMARLPQAGDYVYMAAGLVLIAGAVIIPQATDFMLFKFFMAVTGAFAVVFGRAARTPASLLAVFTVATMFPLFVAAYMEEGYAKTSLALVEALASLLGLPLEVNGQLINLLTTTGQPLNVAVTAACAGPATVGVFLGIFGLMSMDLPLSLKRAGAVFAFGVAGTWLQNALRILIILEVGRNLGEKALWSAHFWTIYALFPAWYLIFAFVYFKQVGGKKNIKKEIYF